MTKLTKQSMRNPNFCIGITLPFGKFQEVFDLPFLQMQMQTKKKPYSFH